MAVIKARKLKFIKAGVVGAVISLIPSLIACGALLYCISKKNVRIEQGIQELEKYTDAAIYVLKKDVHCGQILQPEDIMVVQGKLYSDRTEESMEYYVGKEMLTDAVAGTVLNSLVVAEIRGENNNLRRYFIDYVEVPGELAEGVNFDIRICFPNGEDYLVAGNKEISIRDEEGFYIDLNRREALLMSSAKVDRGIYQGTRVYAAIYSTGFENEEVQTYPVNKYVFSLGQWEPNLKEAFSEEEFLRRETLEMNLLEFMGVTNNLQ